MFLYGYEEKHDVGRQYIENFQYAQISILCNHLTYNSLAKFPRNITQTPFEVFSFNATKFCCLFRHETSNLLYQRIVIGKNCQNSLQSLLYYAFIPLNPITKASLPF